MAEQAILSARDLDFFYGASQALRHISLDIPAGRVPLSVPPGAESPPFCAPSTA